MMMMMMMMRDLEGEEVLKYIPISWFLKIQPVITFSIFTARQMSPLVAGSSELRPQIPQSVQATAADDQHLQPKRIPRCNSIRDNFLLP
jgi:hypothetical protein